MTKYKNISNLLFKLLICAFLLLNILIINKFYPDFTLKIKNDIFNKSFNFVKINALSKKIIGRNVFYFENKNSLVNISNNEINNAISEKYYDGEKFYVSKDLPIGTIQSGIVIFKGEKENFGNTIIIQGTDGYNIWYGNLSNINANLYTYVEKNSLIGSSKDNYIYLLIEKSGNYYTYEEYKN